MLAMCCTVRTWQVVRSSACPGNSLHWYWQPNAQKAREHTQKLITTRINRLNLRKKPKKLSVNLKPVTNRTSSFARIELPVCLWLDTIVADNIAMNGSDDLRSYPADNHRQLSERRDKYKYGKNAQLKLSVIKSTMTHGLLVDLAHESAVSYQPLLYSPRPVSSRLLLLLLPQLPWKQLTMTCRLSSRCSIYHSCVDEFVAAWRYLSGSLASAVWRQADRDAGTQQHTQSTNWAAICSKCYLTTSTNSSNEN